MRGAAMSLAAALSGFAVVLLCVSAVQGQYGWRVTYSRRQICAVKGSTVEISCTYTHPYRISDKVTEVVERFWFRNGGDKAPVDLRTDSDYTGRVQYLFKQKVCSLRITDLRESDSALYKFRFITNQHGGSVTGSPGVFLSVTALQVQVITVENKQGYVQAELQCHSSCLSDHRSYVWKNERTTLRGTSSISAYFYPADRVSCAVKGYEECPSPSVYAPKLPSVSVSPSAEIEEGSSVTLSCSSDANPAAQYTWYREEEESPKASGQNFSITDVRPEHSGNYSCEAQNTRGSQNSTVLLTVVPGAVKSTAAAVTAAVLLPVMFLSVCLWIRTKRTSNGSSEPELRADSREQCAGGQGQPEEQDEPQYASVHFNNNQADPLYSNIRAAQPHRHSEEVTEYAAVRFHRVSPAPRTEETTEDASMLYSTVNKSR